MSGALSNLTLTLPLAVIVGGGVLWPELRHKLTARTVGREFDEDTTLADWQASRRPHLSLLDRPEAK